MQSRIHGAGSLIWIVRRKLASREWPVILLHEMKNGFIPIQLDDYVKRHLQANPEVDRADLVEQLLHAMDAAKRGERCSCGAPIWIIGSAEAGLACFTCITGEAVPDNDLEIELG